MAGLFGGKAKTPPPPKPVRQPTPEDPAMRQAAMRAREDAMRRSGRLSTILTDQTSQTVGAVGNSPEKPLRPTLGSSGGVKLGA